MAADELAEYELRQLQPGDKFTGLKFGDEAFTPLKTFVRVHAQTYSDQLLARTYVLAERERVVAYVTMVCGEIASEREMADLEGADYKYDHYPAVKIARLAVTKKLQDKKLGRLLVEFCLGRSLEISAIAGCRFVVVDAKRASVPFYEKVGFRLLDTKENRARGEPLMFFDLKKAAPAA